MPKAFCSNAGLPGSFTKALSYDEQIQFLINKFNEMAEVVNNLKLETDISNTVQYIPQSGFSDLQKQQATENIRAVSTIANQILDEDEQMNARENINAMEYEAKDEFVKQGGAVVYNENFTEIPPNTNIASIAWCTPGNYYCTDITGITGFSAAMPFEMSVYKVHSNLIRRYFQYDNGRKYVQEVELNPLKFYAILDYGGFNVSYLLQDLTEDQKAQARENIGAGSETTKTAVLYTAQELTNDQKAQARNNIGAGISNISQNDLNNLETNINNNVSNNYVKYTGEQTLTSAQKTQTRNNIGAGTSNITSTDSNLTFAANGWSSAAPYTQSVNIADLTSNDVPIIDFDYSSATVETYANLEENYNKILRFVSGNGTLTAYCYDTIPEIDVKIIVKVVK